MPIDKFYLRHHIRENLLPKQDGTQPTSREAEKLFSQNRDVINRAYRNHTRLAKLRTNRHRTTRYYFDEQLSDYITDPETGETITERDYMIKQGMTPLVINLLRAQGKALISNYRRDKLEPMVIARTRDQQKAGEMMTCAINYVYEYGNLHELNARNYEEFLLSAVPAFRVGYDWIDERQCSDVTVTNCDINRMFWDDDTSGMYFQNITMIGYLHDMTQGRALSLWAKTPAQRTQMMALFKANKGPEQGDQIMGNTDRSHDSINFWTPFLDNKIRIIEVWTKEEVECLECHDTAKGIVFTMPVSTDSEREIEQENESRRQDMIAAGGDPEQAALIKYNYRVSNKWVERFMTTDGYVLHQAISPYAHGEHPFAIGGYPMVDGELHSVIGDALNPQRMCDRLLMRIEFQRMNDAKGFGIVNKGILKRSGVTLREFIRQFTSPRGVVALDIKEGEEKRVFTQYNGNTSTGNNDLQMFNLYSGIIDKQTGASSAMRGEKPSAGTSYSRYLQETENAQNNVADPQDWYNGLIRKRDYKILSVIQQFYDEKRYLKVAGKKYSEEACNYNPDVVRNVWFDLALVQSQSAGVARLQQEQTLGMLVERGLPLELFLESTSMPGADALLERWRSYKQDQANAQQQAAAGNAQQTAQMAL